jgi:hypothetical protein
VKFLAHVARFLRLCASDLLVDVSDWVNPHPVEFRPVAPGDHLGPWRQYRR